MATKARIIPRSRAADHAGSWQRILAEAVTDVHELLGLLGLAGQADALLTGLPDFPLRVPRPFLARMRKGDPHDPLLLQVLPRRAELHPAPGFTPDPLQEGTFMASPGLLQKYHGRALLTLTGACAVHCRYCFRRHFPYADANPVRTHLDTTLQRLRQDPSITEVILSGGDPLSLSDERLAELCEHIGAIAHVQRLRIHTRLPVVIPERIDDSLAGWLTAMPLDTVVVLHVNHPNELDGELPSRLQWLRRATGATLLNQSVLLRDVNDDAGVLADLSERLFAAGVLPYYLHQLDRVQGAAHFEVPDRDARHLHEALRARLPGYLVPRLVRDRPRARAKIPL